MAEPITSNTTTPTSAQDPDFQERHAKDLGVTKFAAKMGFQTLLPIAGMVGGGALGWYFLGPAAEKLLPGIVRKMSLSKNVSKAFWNLTKEDLQSGVGKISEIASEAIAEIKKTDPHFLERGATANDLLRIYHKVKPSQVDAFLNALGIEIKNDERMGKSIAGAALGITGLTAGSVTVAYDQWKNDESARIAAREIDRDISKLEIFRPSNPEIVAENKRLRAMLAEKEAKQATANDDVPLTRISDVQSEGVAKDSAERQRA